MAGPRVVLALVSVNKVVKKQAKRVKGYLRLRNIIQLEHIRSSCFLLRFPGHLLGGGSSLLGSFMIIFGLPKVRFGM